MHPWRIGLITFLVLAVLWCCSQSGCKCGNGCGGKCGCGGCVKCKAASSGTASTEHLSPGADSLSQGKKILAAAKTYFDKLGADKMNPISVVSHPGPGIYDIKYQIITAKKLPWDPIVKVSRMTYDNGQVTSIVEDMRFS